MRAFNPAFAVILLAIMVAGCSSNPLSSSASSSGDGSFRQRVTNLFASTPSGGSDATALTTNTADAQQDCPVTDIRSGASTLPFNTGQDTSSSSLRYQATIARLARECAVRGNTMTMKIGVQGRVVVGPAGGPGQLELPLRFALIQEGPEPKTILTKLHKLPVALADGQSNVPFVDVEEDISFTVPSRTALENYVLYVGFDAAALREAPAKKTRRAR